MKRIIAVIMFMLIILHVCTACGAEAKPYGVFLTVTENLDQFENFETVVIDAQYFSADEIKAFQNKGHKVFTYINIGSLEDFRPYYDAYKDLNLGAYEHWDEEVWVDVADKRWQEFITETLVPDLMGRGIDGFFVDNCDVYYNYPSDQILDGLGVLMKALVNTGKAVLINGGDTFLDAWCENGGSWDEVITGINQETVFSEILWDEKDAFGTADPDNNEYFLAYVNGYASKGAEIYLLEYTRDEKLIEEIDRFCKKNGYKYYVSDSIELDGE